MTETEEMDYQRRFGGIARLYGQHGLERFAHSHICVIGIGGVGSWVVEALARSAVGEITLIDLDHLVESNVNRQIHAMDGQFGKSKVDAMAERIRAINPQCTIHCVEEFISADNLAQQIDTRFDYVIDCIDSFKVKAALIAHCRRNKIKVITVGGAGGQIDPLKIRLGDLSRTEHDPLLGKTRKLLRKEYNFSRNLKRRFDIPCVYSEEQQVYPDAQGEVCLAKSDKQMGTSLNCGGYGSATAVTATFGFVAVSHVLKRLSGR
ncbi:MAG: tRNA cyclic N6-threonylcarbamoyladenosine(37) synthase TcdA [Sedimenticola sp.]